MKRPTRILIAARAGLALLAVARGGARPPALLTTDQISPRKRGAAA